MQPQHLAAWHSSFMSLASLQSFRFAATPRCRNARLGGEPTA